MGAWGCGSYNAITASVSDFLNCVSAGGRSVVRSSPAVDCQGADYTALRPFFVVTLAVVVLGLPVGLLCLLV